MLDFMGYEIVADGVDAGRYATAEVAAQSYVDELYGYISDASKDVMGVRLRFDYTQLPFAELEAECDYWSNQISQDCEEEDLSAFIQYAPDLETAKRWSQEAA
jgi:hypothetical protein